MTSRGSRPSVRWTGGRSRLSARRSDSSSQAASRPKRRRRRSSLRSATDFRRAGEGISAYVGDGRNRWPAVQRLDAAHLFRLALGKGAEWARYRGVAEEGIEFRRIAELIGRRLGLPVVSVSLEEAADETFAPRRSRTRELFGRLKTIVPRLREANRGRVSRSERPHPMRRYQPAGIPDRRILRSSRGNHSDEPAGADRAASPYFFGTLKASSISAMAASSIGLNSPRRRAARRALAVASATSRRS